MATPPSQHSQPHGASAPEQPRTDTPLPPTPPRSPLVQLLLAPILFSLNFFLFDAILPSDSFVIRYRKIAIGAMAAALSGYTFSVIQLFLYPEYSSIWIIVFASSVPTAMTVGSAFLFVRCTKSAPDWVFLLATLGALTTRIPWVFVQHAIDEEPTAFAYVMILLGGQVNKVGTGIGFMIATFVITVNSFMLMDWFGFSSSLPTIAWPVTHPNKWFFLYLPHLMCTRFPFLVLCGVVVVLFRQLDTLIRRAEAGATMSRDIAEKLQKYDTEGARKILQAMEAMDESGATSENVDPNLLHAFEGIIENLDKYRPFLPNYMLPDSASTNDAEASDSEEGDDEEGESPVEREGNTRDSKGGGGGGKSPAVAVTQSPALQSLPSERPSHHAESARGVTPTPQYLHEITGPSDVTGFAAAVPLTRSKVSVCVAAATWIDGAELSADHFNELVAAARTVATSTQASLHSFIGDRIVATWNATKRTGKPEARACAFPLRLRAAVHASASLRSLVSLASMTSSRPAHCCLAGDTKLRLFACSSPMLWSTVYGGLARAQKLELCGMDNYTRDHVSVDFQSRGFGLLRLVAERSGKAPGVPIRLYKLVAERDVEEKDQEWMYTLESQGVTPDEKVNGALDHFAVGRAEEAWATLQQIDPAAEAMQDPCVQSLLADVDLERRKDYKA